MKAVKQQTPKQIPGKPDANPKVPPGMINSLLELPGGKLRPKRGN